MILTPVSTFSQAATGHLKKYLTTVSIAVFIFFIASIPFHTDAQKTDKVYLRNGDILTGEVKNLKLALLSFDVDGPGKINIKWEKVIRIKSQRTFEIVLTDGEIFLGPLDSAFFAAKHFVLNDIVEVVPIRSRFLRRLSGDVQLGFNYTKSNSILQYNFGGSIAYRIPKAEIGLDVNSFRTTIARDSLVSKKQDIILNGIKYFEKRLFVNVAIGWQQNTELGLANRFLVSGAFGKAPDL